MFGFKENTVFNNNRIRGEFSVGVNVCFVIRREFFAVNGEGVGIRSLGRPVLMMGRQGAVRERPSFYHADADGVWIVFKMDKLHGVL